MKTNLKDNILIVGFNSIKYPDGISSEHMWWDGCDDLTNYVLLYSGKTSEISEVLAKKCVKKSLPNFNTYLNYDQKRGKNNTPFDKTELMWFKTAKESIQSACKDEYCLIYKIS